ncbi:MAG: hypothetical protein FWB72_00215 [Firmicutes bacterium]|nr:hypothetical protein [Bacillota bacterium]
MSKRLFRILLALALTTAMIFVLAACGNGDDNGDEPDPTPTVTGVTITGPAANYQFNVGTTITFGATVQGEHEPAQTVTWSIPNAAEAERASITEAGVLSATAVGNITVRATSTVNTAMYAVRTVEAVPGVVSNITASVPTLEIILGTGNTPNTGTFTLTLTGVGEFPLIVTLASSAPTVATVPATVTAVRSGTTATATVQVNSLAIEGYTTVTATIGTHTATVTVFVWNHGTELVDVTVTGGANAVLTPAIPARLPVGAFTFTVAPALGFMIDDAIVVAHNTTALTGVPATGLAQTFTATLVAGANTIAISGIIADPLANDTPVHNIALHDLEIRNVVYRIVNLRAFGATPSADDIEDVGYIRYYFGNLSWEQQRRLLSPTEDPSGNAGAPSAEIWAWFGAFLQAEHSIFLYEHPTTTHTIITGYSSWESDRGGAGNVHVAFLNTTGAAVAISWDFAQLQGLGTGGGTIDISGRWTTSTQWPRHWLIGVNATTSQGNVSAVIAQLLAIPTTTLQTLTPIAANTEGTGINRGATGTPADNGAAYRQPLQDRGVNIAAFTGVTITATTFVNGFIVATQTSPFVVAQNALSARLVELRPLAEVDVFSGWAAFNTARQEAEAMLINSARTPAGLTTALTSLNEAMEDVVIAQERALGLIADLPTITLANALANADDIRAARYAFDNLTWAQQLWVITITMPSGNSATAQATAFTERFMPLLWAEYFLARADAPTGSTTITGYNMQATGHAVAPWGETGQTPLTIIVTPAGVIHDILINPLHLWRNQFTDPVAGTDHSWVTTTRMQHVVQLFIGGSAAFGNRTIDATFEAFRGLYIEDVAEFNKFGSHANNAANAHRSDSHFVAVGTGTNTMAVRVVSGATFTTASAINAIIFAAFNATFLEIAEEYMEELLEDVEDYASADFSPATWTAFNNARTAATALLENNNRTAFRLLQAMEALWAAHEALVTVEEHARALLQAEILRISNLEALHTAASWTASGITAHILTATTAVENDALTAAQLDAARTALTSALTTAQAVEGANALVTYQSLALALIAALGPLNITAANAVENRAAIEAARYAFDNLGTWAEQLWVMANATAMPNNAATDTAAAAAITTRFLPLLWAEYFLARADAPTGSTTITGYNMQATGHNAGVWNQTGQTPVTIIVTEAGVIHDILITPNRLWWNQLPEADRTQAWITTDRVRHVLQMLIGSSAANSDRTIDATFEVFRGLSVADVAQFGVFVSHSEANAPRGGTPPVFTAQGALATQRPAIPVVTGATFTTASAINAVIIAAFNSTLTAVNVALEAELALSNAITVQGYNTTATWTPFVAARAAAVEVSEVPAANRVAFRVAPVIASLTAARNALETTLAEARRLLEASIATTQALQPTVTPASWDASALAAAITAAEPALLLTDVAEINTARTTLDTARTSATLVTRAAHATYLIENLPTITLANAIQHRALILAARAAFESATWAQQLAVVDGSTAVGDNSAQITARFLPLLWAEYLLARAEAIVADHRFVSAYNEAADWNNFGGWNNTGRTPVTLVIDEDGYIVNILINPDTLWRNQYTGARTNGWITTTRTRHVIQMLIGSSAANSGNTIAAAFEPFLGENIADVAQWATFATHSTTDAPRAGGFFTAEGTAAYERPAIRVVTGATFTTASAINAIIFAAIAALPTAPPALTGIVVEAAGLTSTEVGGVQTVTVAANHATPIVFTVVPTPAGAQLGATITWSFTDASITGSPEVTGYPASTAVAYTGEDTATLTVTLGTGLYVGNQLVLEVVVGAFTHTIHIVIE